MSVSISAVSLSKRFRVHRNRPRTLREAIIRKLRGKAHPAEYLWALDNVSFEVRHGQSLGVIGHNGAGKSTLLRLLCGIGRPTSGSIHRTGYVAGLLELGTGFHPLLSGRENIRTAGILSGLTRRQVEALESEMIEFAELEEFIDEPVRTYSTGMYMRLAFASAIQMDPDVLLIDEVLAVGDAAFRKKCMTRLEQFRSSGKTLIITSHVVDQIEIMCDQVLVLEEGKVAIQADPKTAIEHYQELLRERTQRRTAHVSESKSSPEPPQEGSKFGTQEASITGVRFLNDNGETIESIPVGAPLIVEIDTRLTAPLSDFAITLGIFTEKEIRCLEANIPSVKALVGSVNGGGKFRCRIPELPLLPGRYFVNPGLFPTDWGFIYDYHFQAHPLYVVGEITNVTGIISVQATWSAA